MKQLLLVLLIMVNLQAFMTHIKTFSASFTQHIIDNKKITIKYAGFIQAKVPNMVKWSYISPIKKEIFVKDNQVTIVEPEIEQVIISKINSTFAFFQILKNAKKITSNHYISTYNQMKINLFFKNKKLKTISYFDQLQNKVIINFTHQLVNKPIKNIIFNATIPSDYDIVTK